MKYAVLVLFACTALFLSVGVGLSGYLLSSAVPWVGQRQENSAAYAQRVAALEEGLRGLDEVAEVLKRTLQAGAPLIPYADARVASAPAVEQEALDAGRSLVSLTYVGKGFKRAVVDGVYLRPGMRFRGGEVIDIDSSSVTLLKDGKRTVLRSGSQDIGHVTSSISQETRP